MVRMVIFFVAVADCLFLSHETNGKHHWKENSVVTVFIHQLYSISLIVLFHGGINPRNEDHEELTGIVAP